MLKHPLRCACVLVLYAAAMALLNIIREYDKSQSGAAGAEPESPPPQWDSAALFRDDQQMAHDGPVSAAAEEDDFYQLQVQPPVAPPSHDEPVLPESSCTFLDGYSHLFGEHKRKYFNIFFKQNVTQPTRADENQQ